MDSTRQIYRGAAARAVAPKAFGVSSADLLEGIVPYRNAFARV